MYYAINLPIGGFDGDIHLLLKLARQAEEAGWDAVFIEDYILYYADERGPVFDPWLALAGIAVRTQRIRLGITITPLPRRRPWKVAREALTLDHLSGGRFILGVGAGGPDDGSFTHFGDVTATRTRAEMLDESLAIIEGLWSGQPFQYSGKHYQVSESVFRPVPVKTPRIPIWVGGIWPRKGPLQRAARYDGFIPLKWNADDAAFAIPTPEDVGVIRQDIERLRPLSASESPYDIVMGGVSGSADTLKHVRALAARGATWWVEFLSGTFAEQSKRVLQGPPR